MKRPTDTPLNTVEYREHLFFWIARKSNIKRLYSNFDLIPPLDGQNSLDQMVDERDDGEVVRVRQPVQQCQHTLSFVL